MPSPRKNALNVGTNAGGPGSFASVLQSKRIDSWTLIFATSVGSQHDEITADSGITPHFRALRHQFRQIVDLYRGLMDTFGLGRVKYLSAKSQELRRIRIRLISN